MLFLTTTVIFSLIGSTTLLCCAVLCCAVLCYATDIITVSEEEIRAALRIIWERMKCVIEPSAAVGLAVALKPEFKEVYCRYSLCLSLGWLYCLYIYYVVNFGLSFYFSYIDYSYRYQGK